MMHNTRCLECREITEVGYDCICDDCHEHRMDKETFNIGNYRIIKRGEKWGIYDRGYSNFSYDKVKKRFVFEKHPYKNNRFAFKEAKELVEKWAVIKKLKGQKK